MQILFWGGGVLFLFFTSLAIALSRQAATYATVTAAVSGSNTVPLAARQVRARVLISCFVRLGYVFCPLVLVLDSVRFLAVLLIGVSCRGGGVDFSFFFLPEICEGGRGRGGSV